MQKDQNSEPDSTESVIKPTEASELSEPVTDNQTSEAVDDIMTKESDDLLAAEDKDLKQAFSDKPLTLKQKIKNFISNWWNNPKARWLTIGAAVAVVLLIALIPFTRYSVLNIAGVRSSASITVLDDSTQQPLKNVKVSLAGQLGQTNDSGVVKLSHLKQGKTTLSIAKPAFAPINRTVTLGWGSNPMGSTAIKPVGIQYDFSIVDYLSGKPIAKAEASSGDADAIADDQGKLKLTVDKNAPTSFVVSITKDGMRTEKVPVTLDNQAPRTIKMVSGHPHVFVSKRSGKYDVYKVDVDGANEKLLLSGTGSERDDLALIPHPSDGQAALVSTRDNKHDSDGYLLSSLVLIDVTDNSTTTIAQSEQIQVINWSGDNLIYVQIAAGTSAASPRRHRLVSYNTSTKESHEIAATNYFNDVSFAAGKLYYAPSSASGGGAAVGLYKVDPDGSNRQTILPQEVWNIFRVSYDHLTISQQQNWYDYKLGNTVASKLSGEPANPVNRLYVDSPSGKQSLWVDSRDGKGVLLNYDVASQKDATLRSQSGITSPTYWLDGNTIVYRIKTPQETADYVMSINGGDSHKLRDVSNVAGIGTWYYY